MNSPVAYFSVFIVVLIILLIVSASGGFVLTKSAELMVRSRYKTEYRADPDRSSDSWLKCKLKFWLETCWNNQRWLVVLAAQTFAGAIGALIVQAYSSLGYTADVVAWAIVFSSLFCSIATYLFHAYFFLGSKGVQQALSSIRAGSSAAGKS